MTTFAFEGKDRIFFGARAVLLEDNREVASEWARKKVKRNPAYAYVLGKFVEAERANKNQQYWTLDGLQMGKPTIEHAPMNINHSSRAVVGSFVDSELIYPSDVLEHPYIECLAVLWKYYFPEEYRAVLQAHEEGNLYYSMECVPRAVSTVGGEDDSIEYAYEGPTSPNYPEELNQRSVPMNLIDPHFVGGALVIPPEKPGWTEAEIQQIANFFQHSWSEAEIAREIGEVNPDPKIWESLMSELIMMSEEQSRDFNTDQRKKLAKKGHALPDGSFPIVNAEDLKNAIRLAGHAHDPAAARAHIKKRADALGLSEMIPENWD